ncbi:MAG: sigma-70 family RNA polymerase sigma factor [Candidatus Aminicenantes bacterium]|nr:sigma-70 family RNA polymerase sigma factor [Candidatus Aminicenantes bacterium]
MDDRTLVESARQGDRSAFETLVKKYETKVYHLAFSFVRDPATAEDLAQDVFVKAYLHLADFRFDSEFGTWLYRVAVNHVKDHLRKIVRRKEVALDEVEESRFASADPVRGREEAGETERRRAAVHRALDTLPPKYNVILTLRDVRGLSYEEIAQSLKISPGTVDSRLHRARRMLRKKMAPILEREGFGVEGGEA